MEGVWDQSWEAEDGSPGWTFQPETVSEEDERFVEVSGHGPYRWAVGEPWEGGKVIFDGVAPTLTSAKEEAERAFRLAIAPTVTIDMPGILADFLSESEFDQPARIAYDGALTVRRGRGYVLRVVAPVEVHRQFLARCWALEGGPGVESSQQERRAYRSYRGRIEQVEA